MRFLWAFVKQPIAPYDGPDLISALPDELKIKIMGHLHARDVCALGQTSTAWRVADLDAVWQARLCDDFGIEIDDDMLNDKPQSRKILYRDMHRTFWGLVKPKHEVPAHLIAGTGPAAAGAGPSSAPAPPTPMAVDVPS